MRLRASVAQQKAHAVATDGDTAQCRIEIAFFEMQKNGAAAPLFGRRIIIAKLEKHIIEPVVPPEALVPRAHWAQNGPVVTIRRNIITPAAFLGYFDDW